MHLEPRHLIRNPGEGHRVRRERGGSVGIVIEFRQQEGRYEVIDQVMGAVHIPVVSEN
jgi:hypothetical protein